MLNIGIIGFGVVGKATAKSLGKGVGNRFVYDKYNTDFSNNLSQVVTNSDIIFVCVPTPTIDNEQNLEALNDVMVSLSEHQCNSIIVIKSTILPGTTRMMSREFPHLKLAFCPEFLTEQNPYEDSKNPDRVIIGSDKEYSQLVNLHKLNFKCPIYECSWEEAELTKYVSNSFLAMKVIFSNIMFLTAESLDIPWQSIQRMWLDDHRIGKSHTTVPGPDGKFGYGGTCFPKDVKAFITWLNNNGVNPSLLQTVNDINERIR